jgi:hypothetical protein
MEEKKKLTTFVFRSIENCSIKRTQTNKEDTITRRQNVIK